MDSDVDVVAPVGAGPGRVLSGGLVALHNLDDLLGEAREAKS